MGSHSDPATSQPVVKCCCFWLFYRISEGQLKRSDKRTTEVYSETKNPIPSGFLLKIFLDNLDLNGYGYVLRDLQRVVGLFLAPILFVTGGEKHCTVGC